jgi:hypothetical protein
MEYVQAFIKNLNVMPMSLRCASLVNQTTPSTALDVLHYQHAEGGSGHSGTVSFCDPWWNVNMTNEI